MEKLLYNFPALEDLTIGGSCRKDVWNFNISAPELKTLKTIFVVDNYDKHAVPYNFFINAAKLENLVVEGNVMPKFSFRSPQPLDQVKNHMSAWIRENIGYAGA